MSWKNATICLRQRYIKMSHDNYAITQTAEILVQNYYQTAKKMTSIMQISGFTET